MKKVLGLILALAVVGMAAYGITRLSYGYGNIVTATTTPQSIVFTNAVGTNFYAKVVSVYNTGAAVAYAAVNCPTSTFSQMISAGVAIPIPVNMSYYFERKDDSVYGSVCVGTLGGSATVYIGAY